MQIEIFGKPGCARCKTTKNKVSHFMSKWGVEDRVSVTFFDMATPDGMAEAMFNDVGEDLPTTIIRRESEQVARWDGVVPATNDIREHVQVEAVA